VLFVKIRWGGRQKKQDWKKGGKRGRKKEAVHLCFWGSAPEGGKTDCGSIDHADAFFSSADIPAQKGKKKKKDRETMMMV